MNAFFTRADAPETVEVNNPPTVKEGETVRMTCSSDAHPAVSSYEWYDDKGARLHTGQEFLLQNVSRHHSALYCVANNTEGQSKSSPVHLNVLCKSTDRLRPHQTQCLKQSDLQNVFPHFLFQMLLIFKPIPPASWRWR